MTLRAPVSKLVAGECVLSPETSRYLVRVHRLRAGEAFVAFDVDARLEADATLIDADPKRARVRLSAPRPARVTSPLPVTLLWAIGKGSKPDAVVRDATALGVERIVLCVTERSVPRLDDRASARLERWLSVAREAARQSGRGDLPQIEGPIELSAALAHPPSARGIVLDPSAPTSLAAALDGWQADTALRVLIGPEGGLSVDELGAARAAGFRGVRLGSLVLRTETAVVALLGALIARRDGG